MLGNRPVMIAGLAAPWPWSASTTSSPGCTHGFAVAVLYSGRNRPLDGSLVQLDVAFVQAAGRLRRDHAHPAPARADALDRSRGY